jgi:hypothetical protein
MNTIVIMYEDLADNKMLYRYTGKYFTISPLGLQPIVLGRGQIYADSFRRPTGQLKNIPDTSNEVQSHETSSKALDEMPGTMQLLR